MSGRIRRAGFLAIAGVAAGAAASATSRAAWAGGIAMPVDASAQGHRIDGLLHETLILVGVLAVLATGWMAIALILHGRRHRPVYTHGTGWRAIAVPLIMAAVVFTVVDGNLFVRSTVDLDEVFARAEAMGRNPRAVRIEVDARRWVWQIRYAGGDGEFGTADDVVTLDDMRVPIGRPVVIELASMDVIHSLNLPSFRVKLDAIPGRINMTWFRPIRRGSYEIACAQYCGVNHYKMRGLLHVVSEKRYRAWLRDASADAARMDAVATAAATEPEQARLWPRWGRAAPQRWGWPWKPSDRHRRGDAGRRHHAEAP